MIKSIDPSGAPLDAGQRAALVGFATLLGGGLGALAGVNAQNAATAAQNEALNNTGEHTAEAAKSGGLLSAVGSWVQTTYSDPLGDISRWAGQVVGLIQANSGQASPLDLNDQIPGGGNPPATGGAVVTLPVEVCLPGRACILTPVAGGTRAPSNASFASRDGDDDTNSPIDGKSTTSNVADGVPGRVQSRINVTNDSMDHIDDRHLDPTVNASQFSISESDLKSLLQNPATVSTPVSRAIPSGSDLNYVREVSAGTVIGTDKFNNYQATSTMTVITDKYGNLVTAFPGKLK